MSIKSDLNVDVIEKLGEGGFGQVFLVKHLQNNKMMAVKALEKTKFCHNQWTVFTIKRERKILIQLSGYQWFTKLLFAKNSRNAIYFGLEYYCGGDLFDVQRKYYPLNEDTCRFYIAEIIVAMETLHNLGILHRDLKRENIFVTENGHIVIGDFGCATELEDNDLSYNKVGTPGYIAPEVFQGKGYSFPSDVFAVGIIFVELLTGRNPFTPSDFHLVSDAKLRNDLYANQVLYVEPKIANISNSALELAKSVLRKNPTQRATFTHLKKMAFFKNLKWIAVATQRIKPPFVFNCPQNSSKIQLDVKIQDYDGNVTFNDFTNYHQLPLSISDHELILESLKHQCLKEKYELENQYKHKINEMQKTDQTMKNVIKRHEQEKNEMKKVQQQCDDKITDMQKKIEKLMNDGENEKNQTKKICDDKIERILIDTKKIKQQCDEKITDMQKKIEKLMKDYENEKNQIKKVCADKIERILMETATVNQLNPNIQKRPGPKLQDFNCDNKKVPCTYCNKGLSDKKSLKKHIKAIHGNKENC